MTLIEFCFEIK